MNTTHPPRPIRIGMNDRLYATNWRPVLNDIAFAAEHGFEAIQFHGTPDGLNETQLGTSLERTGAALAQHGIAAVMEIIVRVDETGRIPTGATALDVLRANLTAIDALRCERVHWHPIQAARSDATTHRRIERSLYPQFAAAVELAAEHGFRFGFEHNEPASDLFSTPEACAAALAATPGLGFVWDINHMPREQLPAFLALADRMTLLHVADTPLPDVNHHIALGRGNIELAYYLAELIKRGFRGPAILEIGGLPRSGGYGQDTDAALVSSRNVLRAAIDAAMR